jgi:hypothetical protein
VALKSGRRDFSSGSIKAARYDVLVDIDAAEAPELAWPA